MSELQFLKELRLHFSKFSCLRYLCANIVNSRGWPKPIASIAIVFFLFGTVESRPAELDALNAQASDGGRITAREHPFSTRLHIHGSFSEGRGSISSSTDAARLSGVDVLWWSDHDRGFTHRHAAQYFGFEDWEVPRHSGEDWLPESWEQDDTKRLDLYSNRDMTYSALFTADDPYEGQASLLLEGSGTTSQFGETLFYNTSDRPTWDRMRSLAGGVSVELAIKPLKASDDARPIILMELSYHFDPPERLVLKYTLDNTPGAVPYRDGPIFNIPLTFVVSDWNYYSLDPTADAIAGFPEILAVDNSLRDLTFGIEAKSGADVAAQFDQLHVTHAIANEQLYEAENSLLQTISLNEPSVAQRQGLEHTHQAHLNEFSVDTALTDSTDATEIAEQVHIRGGLVSLNHMFGTSEQPDTPSPEELLTNLLDASVYDVDLIEVGYRSRGGRDLIEHFWVWDQLAYNDYFLVGIGVSDHHNLRPGLDTAGVGNNFVSWIYAESDSKGDLIDGLRRGRIFFGDILMFDGLVDLTSSRGFPMGHVIMTDRQVERITTTIDGLAPADEFRLILDGTAIVTSTATTTQIHRTDAIPINGRAHVRAEVWSAEGDARVFSNHLHFVRELPANGVEGERTAIELGGISTSVMNNVRVTDARLDYGQSASELIIELSASSGEINLVYSGHGQPNAVEFTGLQATATITDRLVAITNISGQGQLTVSAAVTEDIDNDQIPDGADNCLNAPNADQIDVDHDGIGNRCDPDLNNDCVVNFEDLALLKAVFFTSDSLADLNVDGSVNFEDLALMKALFLMGPGPSGVPNSCYPF